MCKLIAVQCCLKENLCYGSAAVLGGISVALTVIGGLSLIFQKHTNSTCFLTKINPKGAIAMTAIGATITGDLVVILVLNLLCNSMKGKKKGWISV